MERPPVRRGIDPQGNGAVRTMKPGPKRRPVFERLWEKVRMDPNGCWQWTGAVSGGEGGYAQMRDAGKTIYAHRLSYQTLVGLVPDGLHLDHLCRNRACVNPLHLEPVTCRENLLRGESQSAVNAKKTHCLIGHPLSGENLRMNGGKRVCRRCASAGALASKINRTFLKKGGVPSL